LEASEEPPLRDTNSGNEANIELEPEDDCLWELNPLVNSYGKLDCYNTADDEGEWFINEDVNSAYFPVASLECVSLDEYTDTGDDPVKRINTLPSMHARSGLYS